MLTGPTNDLTFLPARRPAPRLARRSFPKAALALPALLAAAAATAQVDPLPVPSPLGVLPTTPRKAPAAAGPASAPSSEATTSAAASSTAPAPAPAQPFVPLWELGVFGFGAWQPAYPGSDTHLDKGGVLPFAIYRGKVLRLESGQIGLRAVRTPRVEWDVTGSFSFGGGANKVAARAGMPTIGTLVGAGPKMRVNLGPLDHGLEPARATTFELPLRAIFDLNDSLHCKGWVLEPTLSHRWWRTPRSTFITSLSTMWGSRRMGDLFYGVAPEYATADRPAYVARGGLIATRLHAGLHLRLSPTVRVYTGASFETVRGAANETSPLVRRRQDIDLAVGLVWTLRQSTDPAVE